MVDLQNTIPDIARAGAERVVPGSTKARHTPTPWALNDDDRVTIYDPRSQAGIACCNSDRIVPMSPCRQLANAAFIIRAVNLHDELVQTLRAAREYCAHDRTYRSDDGRPLIEVIDALLSRTEEAGK